MAFAIEMFFDDAADAHVRNIWQAIAEAGISRSMLDGVSQPHVTLGVCDSLDVMAFSKPMREFAKNMPALQLSLVHIGVFNTPEGVAFLAPVVTAELLNVHLQFHEVFAQHTQNRWPYYLPGNWVPHCTLAHHVTREQLPQAVEVVAQTPLPFQARMCKLGMMEVAVPQLRDVMCFNIGS